MMKISKMALKKIKYGDTFEFQTPKGLAFFQCVKEAPPTESELIRILPGIYDNVEEVNLEELVNQEEVFFIQFPLKYAVKKKVIKFIANFTVPQKVKIPKYYRTKHVIKGEFICWHIVDSDTYQRRSVIILSDEEKRLSPWGMWNDTLLAERIAEGWKPEDWV